MLFTPYIPTGYPGGLPAGLLEGAWERANPVHPARYRQARLGGGRPTCRTACVSEVGSSHMGPALGGHRASVSKVSEDERRARSSLAGLPKAGVR